MQYTMLGGERELDLLAILLAYFLYTLFILNFYKKSKYLYVAWEIFKVKNSLFSRISLQPQIFSYL